MLIVFGSKAAEIVQVESAFNGFLCASVLQQLRQQSSTDVQRNANSSRDYFHWKIFHLIYPKLTWKFSAQYTHFIAIQKVSNVDCGSRKWKNERIQRCAHFNTKTWSSIGKLDISRDYFFSRLLPSLPFPSRFRNSHLHNNHQVYEQLNITKM